eukprot:TRINITY_DN1954_c0_g1_i1.p1 TRINITY_DN1954_c0_g1~~TRINITY_DN1954_c0_g1_i1.p1  ORF type:complete len:544 (-),score=131.19 TRINITY_DN1954_c0_g1_i1:264-1895(-)
MLNQQNQNIPILALVIVLALLTCWVSYRVLWASDAEPVEKCTFDDLKNDEEFLRTIGDRYLREKNIDTQHFDLDKWDNQNELSLQLRDWTRLLEQNYTSDQLHNRLVEILRRYKVEGGDDEAQLKSMKVLFYEYSSVYLKLRSFAKSITSLLSKYNSEPVGEKFQDCVREFRRRRAEVERRLNEKDSLTDALQRIKDSIALEEENLRRLGPERDVLAKKREDIDILERRVPEYETRVNDAKFQREKIAGEIRKIKSEIETSKIELANLIRQKEEGFSAEIARLNAEIADLRAKNITAGDELRSLIDKLKLLSSQQLALVVEREHIECRLIVFRKYLEILTLESKGKDIMDEILEEENKDNSGYNDIQKFSDHLKLFSLSKKDSEVELTKSTLKKEEIERRLRLIEQEISITQAKIREVRDRIKSIEQQIQNKLVEIERLREKLANIDRLISELIILIKQKETLLAEREAEKYRADEAVANAERERDNFLALNRDKKRSYELEYNEFLRKEREIQERLRRLREELASAQVNYDNASGRIRGKIN